jgi:hypothetical protein
MAIRLTVADLRVSLMQSLQNVENQIDMTERMSLELGNISAKEKAELMRTRRELLQSREDLEWMLKDE